MNILAIIWNLWTFFSFHIEQYALKIAIYVQFYSVLSSSTAHNSAMGSFFYNISDKTDNLDIKEVNLGIAMALLQQTASI